MISSIARDEGSHKDYNRNSQHSVIRFGATNLNFFTTDNYINILKIPKNLNVGVMINVSELITLKPNYEKILGKIFKNKNKSKVKFVRLATHFAEIEEVVKICKILKSIINSL